MELGKLRVENLGYFTQSRLNRGLDGDVTLFEITSKIDVIVINHLLNELGFHATSLEDPVGSGMFAGGRKGHLVSNMPFSESLRLQSAWHTEIIPVVSGERQKQIDAEEAKRQRIEKTNAELVKRSKPIIKQVSGEEFRSRLTSYPK